MFRVDERLEAWLGPREHVAAHPLCWSGVASAPLDLLGDVDLPSTGSTGHATGDAALAEAVARAEGVAVDEVALTAGAGEADALLALVLGRGGRILVEEPAYPPLRDVARLAASRVDRFRRSASSGWAVDVDPLVGMLTPETRLVVLASPNNPTGAVTPRADLVRLAEACERVGAWLLVDEVFRRLQDAPGPSARTLHPRILATGSLTKAEGLGGLRLGWLLAPPEVATAALGLKLATSGPPAAAAQAYALAALRVRGRLLERGNAFRRANLPRLAKLLDGTPGWVPPAAGVCAAVPVPGDDEAFARRLVDETGVLVAPGAYFDAPGTVRVGFGLPPERFEEGLARLAPALRR